MKFKALFLIIIILQQFFFVKNDCCEEHIKNAIKDAMGDIGMKGVPSKMDVLDQNIRNKMDIMNQDISNKMVDIGNKMGAMNQNITSKMGEMKQDIANKMGEINQNIGNKMSEMNKDIAAHKQEIGKKIDDLGARINEVESKLNICLITAESFVLTIILLLYLTICIFMFTTKDNDNEVIKCIKKLYLIFLGVVFVIGLLIIGLVYIIYRYNYLTLPITSIINQTFVDIAIGFVILLFIITIFALFIEFIRSICRCANRAEDNDNNNN